MTDQALPKPQTATEYRKHLRDPETHGWPRYCVNRGTKRYLRLVHKGLHNARGPQPNHTHAPVEDVPPEER